MDGTQADRLTISARIVLIAACAVMALSTAEPWIMFVPFSIWDFAYGAVVLMGLVIADLLVLWHTHLREHAKGQRSWLPVLIVLKWAWLINDSIDRSGHAFFAFGPLFCFVTLLPLALITAARLFRAFRARVTKP